MIPKNVFYDRRDNHCAKCEFWKGACLKGHGLSSQQGCPLKKFDPMPGADYAPDRIAEKAVTVPQPGNCCGRVDDISPMTWAQATEHLIKSTAEWARSGFKTAPDAVYAERVTSCQNGCPHYRWFQCRLCKCCIFVKARVPGETCPASRWKL